MALQALADAHVRYARLQVQWQFIEPFDFDPPFYFWSGIDDAVNGLLAEGFTPIGNVMRNPSWAATTTCGPVDKVPLARYGDFIRALVERYDGDGVADAPGSPRVQFWEVGNEPDYNVQSTHGSQAEGNAIGSCFGGSEADEYGEMLRVAYLEAKAADPTVAVMFGSLAYDRLYNGPAGHSPVGPFDRHLTRNALLHLHDTYGGAGSNPNFPYFDNIGLHVFNDFRNNWDGTTRPFDQELIGKVKYFRNDQLFLPGKFDLRGAPIAVTELSLPSMPSDNFTNRSEALQAVYPGQALVRSMAAGVQMALWFSMEDHRIGTRCTLDNGDQAQRYGWLAFGLLRSEAVHDAIQAMCDPVPPWLSAYQVSTPHEPKPSLDAARVANEQLATTVYDRQLTLTEVGNDNRIEAHRFQETVGGAYVIAVFTDTGERLGRVGTTPISTSMTFSAANLPGWNGSIIVTDHLGNSQSLSGTTINVTVDQGPRYVRVDDS